MEITKRWFFIVIACTGITACALPQVKFSTIQEIRHAVHPRRSTLSAYELTGGIWGGGAASFYQSRFRFWDGDGYS